jgi:hypothetical protein
MPGDQRIGYDPVFTQVSGGAYLIDPHEARITSHVGGQYC